MYVTLFWAVILLLTKRKKNLAKYFLGVFMVAAFLVYLSHAVFFHGEEKQVYTKNLEILVSNLEADRD